MQTNTTRRALIGGAGLAAVVVAASATGPVLAAPTTPRLPTISPELARLIAEVDRVEAICDESEREFSIHAARFDQARSALPHATVDMGEDWENDIRVWSTASQTNVAGAEALVAGWKGEPPANMDFYRKVRRFVAHVRKRDRAADRLRASTGFNAVEQRNTLLTNELMDAVSAVESFPVASIADLNAVLAFMAGRDHMDDDYRVSALAAGIRRLAGEVSA